MVLGYCCHFVLLFLVTENRLRALAMLLAARLLSSLGLFSLRSRLANELVLHADLLTKSPVIDRTHYRKVPIKLNFPICRSPLVAGFRIHVQIAATDETVNLRECDWPIKTAHRDDRVSFRH